MDLVGVVFSIQHRIGGWAAMQKLKIALTKSESVDRTLDKRQSTSGMQVPISYTLSPNFLRQDLLIAGQSLRN